LFARYQRTAKTKPPLPVTSFPGARELANAIRMDVGSATEHDELDFAIFLGSASFAGTPRTVSASLWRRTAEAAPPPTVAQDNSPELSNHGPRTHSDRGG
jgi:hypothetical protein